VIGGLHGPELQAQGAGQQAVQHRGGNAIEAARAQNHLQAGLALVVLAEHPAVQQLQQALGAFPGGQRPQAGRLGAQGPHPRERLFQLPPPGPGKLQRRPQEIRVGQGLRLKGQATRGLGGFQGRRHSGQQARGLRGQAGGKKRRQEQQGQQRGGPLAPFHVFKFIGILAAKQEA
jgi:hypothetical protein